jgi:hypothetical protein
MSHKHQDLVFPDNDANDNEFKEPDLALRSLSARDRADMAVVGKKQQLLVRRCEIKGFRIDLTMM